MASVDKRAVTRGRRIAVLLKRVVLAMCLLVLTLGVALGARSIVTGGGSSQAVSWVCDDVYLIWARGSAQVQPFTEGNQPQGERFDRLLRERVEGAGPTYDSHSLDYPASGAFGGQLSSYIGQFLDEAFRTSMGLDASDYANSVAAGSDRLREDVLSLQDTCGQNSQLVLAGFSQGADVIGEFLASADDETLDGITFVALFGDPRFHGASPIARGVTNTPGGLLGARIPYVPPQLEPRALSFCEPRGFTDAVCDGNLVSIAGSAVGLNDVHKYEYQRDRSTAIPEAVEAIVIQGDP